MAHGRFFATGVFEPSTSSAAILLLKSNGTLIYRAILPAGSLVPRGDGYAWLTRGVGDADGITKLLIKKKGPNVWTFTLEASADLSAADSPDMRFSIRLADEAFSIATRWKQLKHGWVMHFQ